MLPGPEWARSGARARTRACDEGRHERKTPTAGRAAAAPCAAAADTTPANANGSAPAAVPTSGVATSATLRAVVFAEDIHGIRLSLQCTMKPSTLLAKLMRGWSQHFKQPLDGVAFLHGGAVLRPEHTPADLGWSAAREPLEILAVPREDVEGAPPLGVGGAYGPGPRLVQGRATNRARAAAPRPRRWAEQGPPPPAPDPLAAGDPRGDLSGVPPALHAGFGPAGGGMALPQSLFQLFRFCFASIFLPDGVTEPLRSH